ncbi:MAG: hypothetical protein M1365_12535 [Actinobacteria bacterium]|nr:hypothetical protein [Actinomycetota bacterium]
MKKIIYRTPEWKFASDDTCCEVCGEWIDDGDEAYWHGNGTYTCSYKCAKKLEEQ